MNNKPKQYQRTEWDKQRHYKIDGNREYPSSTTILGIKEKPALIPWAAKETAQYAAFKNKTLFELLKPKPTPSDIANLMSQLTSEEYIVDCKGAHRRKSGAAMDIGTIAHDMVSEFHQEEIELRENAGEEFSQKEAADWFKKKIKSIKDAKPEDIEKVKNCIAGFLDWRHKVNFVVVATEFTVFTDKDKYAGTVDALGYVNGKLTLVDYKTSSGIWPDYDLQVSSYLNALLWMIENKLLKFDDVPNAMTIVNFNKEGSLDYKDVNHYEEALNFFLRLRDAFVANQVWETTIKLSKSKANA